jgi:hypothetical protein
MSKGTVLLQVINAVVDQCTQVLPAFLALLLFLGCGSRIVIERCDLALVALAAADSTHEGRLC